MPTENKKCISSFLERMNHEIKNTDIVLDYQGYKIDGDNGIKVFCKARDMKSADYLQCLTDKGFLVVEFSDLWRQNLQIKEDVKKVTASNLDPSLKRDIKKRYLTDINKELVTKYKDTISLLKVINEELKNIPEIFTKIPIYLIVVAPIDPTLDKAKQIEIVKFIDMLQNKVSSAIPSQLYSRVDIITLEQFQR